MVGVPKSRGCATCRKRKIKCDESKPSCLKCIASQFSCPGYTSRLKFQDEGAKLRQKFVTNDVSAVSSSTSLASSSVSKAPSSTAEAWSIALASIPMSVQDELSYSFSETFQSTLPQDKSLLMFGKFITSIPRHTGAHPALDLAMKTLGNGHREWLNGDQNSIVRSRNYYGPALVEIQRSLANGYGDRPVELLCAILMMGIYEVMASTHGQASKRHVSAASRLMELLGPSKFVDPFGLELVQGLSGIIVTEAIINRESCFLDTPEWRALLSQDGIQDPFHTLFFNLQPLPNLLVALRQNKHNLSAEQKAVELQKAKTLRQQLQKWRQDPAYEYFEMSLKPATSLPSLRETTLATIKGLGLVCSYPSMMILVNLVIKGFSEVEFSVLDLENAELADEICQGYPSNMECKPIGSSYMTFSLQVALSVVVEQEKRDWIIEVLRRNASTG